MNVRTQEVYSHESPKSVGILMISTNDYLDLWKKAVESLEFHAYKNLSRVIVHLFTDREAEVESWKYRSLKRIEVKTYPIPSYGWPDVTLLRYKLFSSQQAKINEDLLMYLDSDMLVKRDFTSELFKNIRNDRVAVVQHPGFARNKGLSFLIDMLINPRLITPYFRKFKLSEKGIGSWELNPNSKAFLPNEKRKVYVHGAVWFGWNYEFMKMCKILAERTEQDLDNGIVATWHDESHLNWYIANNNVDILNNRFSGYQDYPNLDHFDSAIVTIPKAKAFTLRDYR
jgi:hypothetical protein